MDNNEESSVPLNWELNPDFNYSSQLSGIRTLIDSVPVTAMPPAVTANTNKCTATEEGANSWEHTSDGTAGMTVSRNCSRWRFHFFDVFLLQLIRSIQVYTRLMTYK
jgi:hypothetical protein